MEIKEIGSGVFACLMGNETANAGFVATERGAVVIDTLDKPAHGRQLAAAIKSRINQPVCLVINTHHHYDHIFGNQAFDAPVVAHHSLSKELAKAAAQDLMPVSIAAWVSAHPQDRWLADELELVTPNLLFQRRMLLEFPPVRMVVQHLGGHTPDTSIVDLPGEGLLFAGDLIFEGRVPFLRQANFDRLLKALRALERLGARTIVPGHGQVCDMGYVVRFRDYVEELLEKIQDLMTRGWEKGDILDSDQLPDWWTDDRPELLRANVARAYDELAHTSGPT